MATYHVSMLLEVPDEVKDAEVDAALRERVSEEEEWQIASLTVASV
jgi:hypothetical protein